MDATTKKAVMLFKSLIFHYHGLDQGEKAMLEATSKRLNADDELNWANNFIAEDHLTAFERARAFLSEIFLKMSEEERILHLMDVWEENYKKGYITEIETTAILTLSKDWQVEKAFLKRVKD